MGKASCTDLSKEASDRAQQHMRGMLNEAKVKACCELMGKALFVDLFLKEA